MGKYIINWEKLSNDKLLELWLYSKAPETGAHQRQIEAILKARGVIKEV